MMSLLRPNCIKLSFKSLSPRFSAYHLTAQCSLYHVQSGILCPKNLLKRNLSYTGVFYNNFHQCISHKPTLILTSGNFTNQRRSFSLKDTIESGFTAHTAIFKKISESSVVQYTQNCIVSIHDITGLPWWLSIIFVTCLVRCFITLPLAVYQSYVIARLENITKEMDRIRNDLKYNLDREVRERGLPESKARAQLFAAHRREWKRLIERDNCHPAKASILAIIQIPTWIIFTTAIRNLVYMLPHQDAAAAVIRLGLTLGGLPWCTNLTVPDSFIIPITLGLTNLLIIEVQTMMLTRKKSRLGRYLTNFFRGFAIFMIPVAASVPSAVSLYWLASSVFGLGQNLLVASPRLRRLCNFPSNASFNPHPYSHLAQQIRNKFRS